MSEVPDPYVPNGMFTPNPYYARMPRCEMKRRRIDTSSGYYIYAVQDCACGGYADASFASTLDMEVVLAHADRAFHDHLTQRMCGYKTTEAGVVQRA